jgi:c-di-GMP-binding flagellar brake protein YcgR
MSETKNTSTERRKVPRSKRKLRMGISHGGEQMTACHTEDISNNGVSCLFPHELALFTMYDVTICVSDSEEEVVSTTAVVVRSEPIQMAGNTLYRTALYFSRIEEEEKARIQKYIDNRS